MAREAPTSAAIAAALAAYPGLAGATASPLGGGLINDTFAVEHDGAGYILQRLHPIFDPAIHDNIVAVTERLRARGELTPRLLHSGPSGPRGDRLPYVDLGEAGIWRLMTRLPGASVTDLRGPRGPARAHSAGARIARFHAALADLDHRFVGLRAGVHDTQAHLQTLRAALAEHPAHRLHGAVTPLAAALFAAADTLPPLARAPLWVTHGDLKISNILFEGDRAIALIDLDTVAPAPLWIELGDAWRSWCNPHGEDSAEAAFDLEIFAASLAGYTAAQPRPITGDERQALVHSVEWIALELTARFAADALHERYFGWDPQRFPAAGEHNLQRARGQWSLFQAALATRDARAALLLGGRRSGRLRPPPQPATDRDHDPDPETMSAPPPDPTGARPSDAPADSPPNFIREAIEALLTADPTARIATRFPPEPNGYLHIGHAKAIVLNFGLATLSPQGTCNLRFDDTNPTTEEVEYVESIKEDVRWLGYTWSGEARFASDYFEQLYQWAIDLIKAGKAYVDSQSLEEIREGRGDYHREGIASPYRERSVAENLDLFQRMRAGEFADGVHVLRAKIDMASKDVKLRDPLMYRIRRVPHHRTGDAWPIYPMYDWAHGQSDAIEGITHSICTLEFQNHRPLYDWFLDTLGIDPRPRQTEFGRLNLSYTVLSKRKLQRLVKEGHVAGWDDPRMPTIAGLRRRGIPPAAIRAFCERIGVSKRDGVVDVGLLEFYIREELNRVTPRLLAVLRPLKVVVTNLPEDASIAIDAPLHPSDPGFASRPLRLTRELWIDREDFMEAPPKKFFRLAPGREVRLRYAAIIRCDEVIKDDAGEPIELRCTWDPETLGKNPPDGRKVKGTIHWVSAADARDAEIRLYDRLFQHADPAASEDFIADLNPSSLEILRGCKVEAALAELAVGARVQLERTGYFCVDPETSAASLVLNRTIALKDSWAKIAGRSA